MMLRLLRAGMMKEVLQPPQTTNIPKDRDRRHSAPMIDGEDEADLAISTHIGAEAKDEY
jgi:hypothetical protein